jgi:hypothetical protein
LKRQRCLISSIATFPNADLLSVEVSFSKDGTVTVQARRKAQ